MDSFTWTVRVSGDAADGATAFARGRKLEIGAAVQFDEEYERVTALECVLGALGADIVSGLKRVAKRRRVVVDHVEATVQGELENALTHLGVVGEEGHPGLERVKVKVYVSTVESEQHVERVWQEALEKSPLVQTFRSAAALDLGYKIVL